MADEIVVDYVRLKTVCGTFETLSDNVMSLQNRLHQQVENLRGGGWVGRGANAFYTEMDNEVLSTLHALTQALLETQQILSHVMTEFQNADEGLTNGLFFSGASTGEGRFDNNASTPSKKFIDGGLYGPNGQPHNGNPDTIFVPGILTDPEGFAEFMAQVKLPGLSANQLGDFAAIYNESDGFVNDIGQALNDRSQAELSLRFGENRAVTTMVQQIENALRDGRSLHLIGHSQGGAITSAALMEVMRRNPNADLSKITVTTYGSAGTAYPPGPKYTHYVIHGDPVPILAGGSELIKTGNPIAAFSKNYHFYANVVLLPPTVEDIPNYLHTLPAYNNVINAPHIPSINQVVDYASQATANLINNGQALFDSLF